MLGPELCGQNSVVTLHYAFDHPMVNVAHLEEAIPPSSVGLTNSLKNNQKNLLRVGV
jgi:hypothetical protein